jgi:hypothetical protein
VLGGLPSSNLQLTTLFSARQFKALDFQRIFDSMSKPAFIFDGRNILDHSALQVLHILCPSLQGSVCFNFASAPIEPVR